MPQKERRLCESSMTFPNRKHRYLTGEVSSKTKNGRNNANSLLYSNKKTQFSELLPSSVSDFDPIHFQTLLH